MMARGRGPRWRARLLYAAGVAGLMVAVAVVWYDRLDPVLWNARLLWETGGVRRLYVAWLAALFFGILVTAILVISTRVEPVRDAKIVAAAALLGGLYEWWGTELELWRYFTGERPPIWIIFAWPVGALVVDRAWRWARARLGGLVPERVAVTAYGILAVAIVLGLIGLARPAWGHLGTWVVVGAIAAGLALRRDRVTGFWILATSLVGLLLADLWGTASECWSYYLQTPRSPRGQALGILFGMMGNTGILAIVLHFAKGDRERG